jgi:hypothetical protein
MGGGGGGQNTVSQTTMDPRQAALMEQNYNAASGVANRDFQQYTGDRVADLNSDQQNLFSGVRDMQGTGAQQIGVANGYAQAAGNYQPQMVATGQTAQMVGTGTMPGNLSAYVNPELENVVAASEADGNRQRLLAQNSLADQARNSGASNGSRAGVQAAVLDAEAARNQQITSAGLRSDAWNTAAQNYTSDQNRLLQAGTANQAANLQAQGLSLQGQTANQGAGLQQAQNMLGASSTLAQNAQTQGALTTNELGLLDTVGQQQRAYDQQGLDAQQAMWNERWNYPVEQQNLRNAAYSGVTYSPSQSSTTTGGAGNLMGQILGGATAGAGIYSMLG